MVSFWKITIKVALGKSQMTRMPEAVWRDFERQTIATVLPIRADHLRGLGDLPMHHRDPFDRLIVAQVRHEGCTLISSDARLDTYGIPRLW